MVRFCGTKTEEAPAQLARTTSKSNDLPVGESSFDGVESGVTDAPHAQPHDNALLNIVSGKLASLTAGVSERLGAVRQNIAESVNNNLYKKEMALAQTDDSMMKTDGVDAPESTVAMAASPATDSSQPQKPPFLATIPNVGMMNHIAFSRSLPAGFTTNPGLNWELSILEWSPAMVARLAYSTPIMNQIIMKYQVIWAIGR